MDFDSILKYKPKDLEDVESEADVMSAKRRAAPTGPAEPRAKRSTQQSEELETKLQQIRDDSAAAKEFTDLDMRKLALGLEKKVAKNQELRIKFAAEPMKFLDSEVALHEEITNLSVAATVPEFYPVLIQLDTPKTLVQLLLHENSDVVGAVLTSLNELTDIDALEDNPENAAAFVDSLLEADLFAQLLPTLQALDAGERETAESVSNALGLVENIIELKKGALTALLEGTKLMQYLMQLAQARTFDDNKQQAMELLSVMLQSTQSNACRFFKDADGIEFLLQIAAYYKDTDPRSDEETEFLENTYNCICSCLLNEECRTAFVDAEGVELLVLILRKRKLSRFSALRALEYSLIPSECSKRAAVIVVEQMGLGALFPAFMKTPKAKKYKVLKGGEAAYEEHITAILAALLRELQEDPVLFKRLLGKFAEQSLAKCVRAAELHQAYYVKVQACEAELQEERKLAEQDGEVIDEDYLFEDYVTKLARGLTTLQHVDFIIGAVVRGFDGQVMREEMARILKLKGSDLSQVALTLLDFARNLDDPSSGFGATLLDLARAVDPSIVQTSSEGAGEGESTKPSESANGAASDESN
eukprot:m.32986 g.32986  ORF g.32986 m.32986 type:complete len:589 (+) comp9565_c0_seq2:98-1864(+)